KYFRPSRSTTFHGRDIFAPVAGALSKGVKPEKLGPQIDDEVRLEPLDRVTRIIHIDRFGNCITNITRDQLKPGAGLLIRGKTIRKFRKFYGEDSSSKPFAIWGSAGFLEISVNGGSAAKKLRVEPGDKVNFTQRRKGIKKDAKEE